MYVEIGEQESKNAYYIAIPTKWKNLFTHQDLDKFAAYSAAVKKHRWQRKLFATPFNGKAIFANENSTTVFFKDKNYFFYRISYAIFLRLRHTRSDLLLHFFTYGTLVTRKNEDYVETVNKRMQKKIAKQVRIS